MRRRNCKRLKSMFVCLSFSIFSVHKEKFTRTRDSFLFFCFVSANTQLSYRQSEFVGQKSNANGGFFSFSFHYYCCYCCGYSCCCCCHSLYGKLYTHSFHLWKWMLTYDCSQLKFVQYVLVRVLLRVLSFALSLALPFLRSIAVIHTSVELVLLFVLLSAAGKKWM